MKTEITATDTNKYTAQVYNIYNGAKVLIFETPEYITPRMAAADAECWIAFHGSAAETRAFIIDPHDTVASMKSRNGNSTTWTGAEFIDWVTARQVKFPEMTWRIASEYNHKIADFGKFFFLIRNSPDKIIESGYIVTIN